MKKFVCFISVLLIVCGLIGCKKAPKSQGATVTPDPAFGDLLILIESSENKLTSLNDQLSTLKELVDAQYNQTLITDYNAYVEIADKAAQFCESIPALTEELTVIRNKAESLSATNIVLELDEALGELQSVSSSVFPSVTQENFDKLISSYNMGMFYMEINNTVYNYKKNIDECSFLLQTVSAEIDVILNI